MTVTAPTRTRPTESDFVHINVRLPKAQADYLRTCADASYLDMSKIVRALIADDMRTTDERIAA